MAKDSALAQNCVTVNNPELNRFRNVVGEDPNNPQFEGWTVVTEPYGWHTVTLPNWTGNRKELFALFLVPLTNTTTEDPTV
jgi:hypothetical protein